MFEKTFVPTKPFADFKWKWASLQCTEGLNDPVVLLGVLARMHKLEHLGVKYSSPEFARELVELSQDIADTDIGVDLARRTGARNLIRNSGQYWKAVDLIPNDSRGFIRLTEFGRKVATREVSQAEFAAITIQRYTLPNTAIQTQQESQEWVRHGLFITPLRLILQIVYKLSNLESGEGFITADELTKVIIPLSGCRAELEDYTNFIRWYRNGELNMELWPNCCPEANDFRIAREYLLFLSNYGYLNQSGTERLTQQYRLNDSIKDEIYEIVSRDTATADIETALRIMRETRVVSEVERKRVRNHLQSSRPNQARFRKDVIDACQYCVVSYARMPEILEAAHIKPYKYNGEDTIANGFAMRVDIHTLFDTGHLRISPDGDVELSMKARLDYGSSIPPRITIPDFINRDFLRWRWENYNGL